MRFSLRHQNEIREKDAVNLIRNGVRLVCEGADRPSRRTRSSFSGQRDPLCSGEAANAGGVAVALEMAQNRMLLNWPRQEVDQRLKGLMRSIHQTCLDVAAGYNSPGNYFMGADIAGFVRVVNSMLDQGLV